MNYLKSMSSDGTNITNQIGAGSAVGLTTYLILVLVLIVVSMAFIMMPVFWPVFIRQFKKTKIWAGEFIHKKGINEENQYATIQEEMEIAGYSYDPEQDIFYSIYNPWQKKFGYCRLYDEAAAPFGLIVDCEPITFEYQDQRWLIEFWKGQYDLTTGAEIGVYTSKLSKLKIPDLFEGFFYECAEEEDQLEMSFTLYKNGQRLFERSDLHWWLTGFKLGEFTEPSELVMEIQITLKDNEMRDAFINGLLEIDYDIDELHIYQNTVSFIFDEPHTPQPITRTEITDWIIQRKNEQMCIEYQEITKPYGTMESKANAVQKSSPELYGELVHMGKKKEIYDVYYSLEKYFEEK